MTKIDFQRIVRDCPANDSNTDPRKMIYDFEVLIDGEVRAIWEREYGGRGYALHGPMRDPIATTREFNGNPERWYEAKAEKQADFVAIIEGLLLSNLIPTKAELEQRHIGWGRALLEHREQKRQERKLWAIKEHAANFYQLAVLVRDGVEVSKAAGKLLAKVDKRAADASRNDEENSAAWHKWEAAAVAAFEKAGTI